MLKKAADWLASKMLETNGITVTYRRQETGTTVSVSAVVGRTVFDVDEGYGQITRFESRDFLINKSDLIGFPFETTPSSFPQRGDEIDELVLDDVRLPGQSIRYRYEVMAPSGQAVWEYADASRNLLRVHTKLINETELIT